MIQSIRCCISRIRDKRRLCKRARKRIRKRLHSSGRPFEMVPFETAAMRPHQGRTGMRVLCHHRCCAINRRVGALRDGRYAAASRANGDEILWGDPSRRHFVPPRGARGKMSSGRTGFAACQPTYPTRLRIDYAS